MSSTTDRPVIQKDGDVDGSPYEALTLAIMVWLRYTAPQICISD